MLREKNIKEVEDRVWRTPLTVNEKYVVVLVSKSESHKDTDEEYEG